MDATLDLRNINGQRLSAILHNRLFHVALYDVDIKAHVHVHIYNHSHTVKAAGGRVGTPEVALGTAPATEVSSGLTAETTCTTI